MGVMQNSVTAKTNPARGLSVSGMRKESSARTSIIRTSASTLSSQIRSSKRISSKSTVTTFCYRNCFPKDKPLSDGQGVKGDTALFGKPAAKNRGMQKKRKAQRLFLKKHFARLRTIAGDGPGPPQKKKQSGLCSAVGDSNGISGGSPAWNQGREAPRKEEPAAKASKAQSLEAQKSKSFSAPEFTLAPLFEDFMLSPETSTLFGVITKVLFATRLMLPSME